MGWWEELEMRDFEDKTIRAIHRSQRVHSWVEKRRRFKSFWFTEWNRFICHPWNNWLLQAWGRRQLRKEL